MRRIVARALAWIVVALVAIFCWPVTLIAGAVALIGWAFFETGILAFEDERP